MSTPFVTVPEALEEFARGRMVVVVDDEDRENEGDLTLAAEFVTPEAINFMATFGRGLICLTLTEDWADHMRLGPMTQENSSRFGTAFTQSIEAAEGVTTGISARDRAHTIRVAIDPDSTAQDLARPGHIFPLRARKGGVLVRAGQTEASVDLARMAGLNPSGVICEIMKTDGTMARVPDLITFCDEHGLKMLTVAELIRYRRQNERYVRKTSEERLSTAFADFRLVHFESEIDNRESHIALVLGDVTDSRPALVCVHRQCLRGDVFNSTACNCRSFVDQSLRAIAQEGRGALIYLDSLGQGCETEKPTPRPEISGGGRLESEKTLHHTGIGGQILSELGIQKIRLMTNTPTHLPALAGFGLEVAEFVPFLPEERLYTSTSVPIEGDWFASGETLLARSVTLP